MTKSLGEVLRQARERKGLSIRALGREADISDTTIMRIENGTHTAPTPEGLAKLAEVLELSLAKLYNLAGYPVPDNLPSMPAYLRAKYPNLPTPARQELNNYLKRLKEQYGLDENGPKRGEDEK